MAVAVSHNVATVWRSGSMSVTSLQQNYNPLPELKQATPLGQ